MHAAAAGAHPEIITLAIMGYSIDLLSGSKS